MNEALYLYVLAAVVVTAVAACCEVLRVVVLCNTVRCTGISMTYEPTSVRIVFGASFTYFFINTFVF